MNYFPNLFEGHYDYLLREVLESVDDAVIVFNDKFAILYANPAAEEVFGGRTEKLVARNIKSLIPKVKRDDFDDILSTLDASVLNEVRLKGKKEFIGLCDKTHFYAEGKLAKFKQEGAYILVLRDITWRKTIEDELQTALTHLKDVGSKVNYRLEHPSIMEEFSEDD